MVVSLRQNLNKTSSEMVSSGVSDEPQAQLESQTWITAPATQSVIAALQADGTQVRFIGGCVRDALAKRSVNDIDIATPDHPRVVLKLLESAGIRAVPTNLAHGTVTAVSGDKGYQITTLRQDKNTDGRRAEIAFTDNWGIDSQRRDLTINAMSATRNGEVYDYNNGITDLTQGRVQFIGQANKRIKEDYLRILRFFRFQGMFGKLPPNQEALDACRYYKDQLKYLPGERVRQEFMKILLVPEPAEILLYMQETATLDVILPNAGNIAKLQLIHWLETDGIKVKGVTPNGFRRLTALINQPEMNMKNVIDRLKFTKKERAYLTQLSMSAGYISADSKNMEIKRTIRRLGSSQTRDVAILNWANELLTSSSLSYERTKSYLDILELCSEWNCPDFSVTGGDLLALGIPAGPQVGQILKRVESWWEAGGYSATRQQCLVQLAKEIGGG
ncbi:MAG: hypothetical protein CBB68_14215 [Rhodospirillaceae bacterium TMED8]|nr:tRNA nucleotidyltransferase [Magnetovibrio sp.]OUT48114.1 MAG: hypothetical protein CBB68_14215 [Rhodospirillaceae bacterium TMED8]